MELRNFRRGRHLYSAGWPSRWASAHILVSVLFLPLPSLLSNVVYVKTRMWADAQRDGRPAEYRTRRLRKFRNSIPCTTPQSLADARCWSAVPVFFPIVDVCLSCEDIARQSCAMVPRWRFLATFCVLYFQRTACSTFQTCILNLH